MDIGRFACPECRNGPLSVKDEARLSCPHCGSEFPVVDGIPILLPPTLNDIASAEINYWSQRGNAERANIAKSYGENYLEMDIWGLYGYKDVLLGLGQDAHILEVGAGTHPLSLYLSRFRHQHQITISDISAVQLGAVKDYCQSVGLDSTVRFVAADMESLPFSDDAFDAVLVHAALHHVPNVDRAVSEFIRCVRRGGLVIIGHEPNESMIRLARRTASITRLGEKHKSDCYSVADDELAGLSPDGIAESLEKHGANIERIDRQWYTMALIHPLPLLVSRATGRQIRIPKRLVTASVFVDQAMQRVPGLRRLNFHFSVISRKIKVVEAR